MVVVLLVGLVALVSTQIPLLSLSSWRKGTERLRMQRDANVAMIRIQRRLRPASNDDVPNSYTLRINQDTGESFFLYDKTLSYQASSGAPTEIVIGGADAPFYVTSFDVASSYDIVNIALTLKMKRESVKTTLRTTVKPRN